MRKKLSQFMISPVFNRASLNARSQAMTAQEYRAEIIAGEKQLLKDMRQPVIDIVTKHEGVIVSDGSGYGVPGDRFEHSHYMIVQVPPQAVAELQSLPDARVDCFENRVFHLPKTF